MGGAGAEIHEEGLVAVHEGFLCVNGARRCCIQELAEPPFRGPHPSLVTLRLPELPSLQQRTETVRECTVALGSEEDALAFEETCRCPSVLLSWGKYEGRSVLEFGPRGPGVLNMAEHLREVECATANRARLTAATCEEFEYFLQERTALDVNHTAALEQVRTAEEEYRLAAQHQ